MDIHLKLTSQPLSFVKAETEINASAIITALAITVTLFVIVKQANYASFLILCVYFLT